MKPYEYKKIFGGSKQEREIDLNIFGFSSMTTQSIDEGKRIDSLYKELCESQGRKYVRGHKIVLMLPAEGTVETGWKIGYCRNKPKRKGDQ